MSTPAADRRKAKTDRAERVRIVADALMRADGYGYDAEVLASGNPKCVRWREAAEAVVARLELLP